jgi:membrane-associated phospholipid phosphatase
MVRGAHDNNHDHNVTRLELAGKAIVGLSSLGAGAAAIFLVVDPIRYVYPRPRPFVVLNIPHLLAVTSMFPSGHTIFVFSIAPVLFFYYRPLGYFAYASRLMIGLA